MYTSWDDMMHTSAAAVVACRSGPRVMALRLNWDVRQPARNRYHSANHAWTA